MKTFPLTVGFRVGKIEVLSFSRMAGSYQWWNCKCDCGVTREIRRSSILRRKWKRCRCIGSSEMGKLTILSNGKKLTCLYDEEDHKIVSSHHWSIASGYAICMIDGKISLMHRMILGLKDGKIFTDHANGIRLDNRRSNLRKCTNSQNMANSKAKKRRLGASKYRGVTFPEHPRFGGKTVRLIRADIRINKVKKNLGYFKTEEDAARAYDAAAIKVYGEFATLNFPA